MKSSTKMAFMGVFILMVSLSFISAIIVNADYVTIYPGGEGSVKIKVDNNENFDIEDVTIAIVPSTVGPTGEIISLPFSVVGNSEKDLDDLDTDDDDSTTFRIRADSDITPGSYNIPYVVSYTNTDIDEKEQKEGTFGIRVSAKTDVDFSAEVSENAIVGTQGRITLNIINKGLGDLKSVSVEIFPSGFELLSGSKVFIGTINADDTDLASFDVVFSSPTPSLSAKVDYKDFDNTDQTSNVYIPLKVYTREEALSLGLIQQSRTVLYVGIVVALIIIWFIYRRIRKRNKKKNRG